MADIKAHHPGIAIGQALRELPQEMPLHSAWPMLAKQLPMQASRKAARHYLPWALAAGLALLAVVPMSLHAPSPAGAGAEQNLQAVIRESSQLENILAATRNSTASSASAEVISLALEDRIHAIDAQLAAGTLDTRQQLELWQERIGILQEATSLYSSQRYRQAEGRPYEIALVESF